LLLLAKRLLILHFYSKGHAPCFSIHFEQINYFSMKTIPILLAFLLFTLHTTAQDTFSIIAIDTITGEIGSAGASCLDNNQFPGSGGAVIISDILPGKGAIHTQSYWLAQNQANARLKMQEGLAPADILIWLRQNDPEGAFGALKRQYGIVDLDTQGHPRAAAFTGSSCLNYKNHKTGPNYSIQGNILLGPQILDSIEAHFLSSTGTLADRLMFALQGANVPGADSRCLNNGTSSLSAFLRVAKPDDSDDNLFLDLNVPSLPAGMEPIDSLQVLYDQWAASVLSGEPETFRIRIFPNPAEGQFSVVWDGSVGVLQLFNLTGQLMMKSPLIKGENRFSPEMPTGLFLAQITAGNQTVLTQKLFWTHR
jgi:uncharacterized Ntn-hydrolase superfamily protein